jgi:hypothetical protein
MAIQIDLKCNPHLENNHDGRLSLINGTLAEIIPAKLLERSRGEELRRYHEKAEEHHLTDDEGNMYAATSNKFSGYGG